jgi:antitoxin ChpS
MQGAGDDREEPRYSLSELMRQCDASIPFSAEDREWLDAPAVGNEAL